MKMAIISESYEMGDRFIWCNDDMGMHSISHTIYCELYSQPSLILSEFEVILDIVVLHARGRSLTLLCLRGSREANATSTLILEVFTQLPIILANEGAVNIFQKGEFSLIVDPICQICTGDMSW